MNHDEKVALAVSDLTARGVKKGAISPPIFRLAWRLGIAIPPPHFLGFGGLAMIMGAFFGVLWGAFMWIFFWRDQGLPVFAVVGLSLAAGVLFGIAMASYYRWKARKLGLPSWRDYQMNG